MPSNCNKFPALGENKAAFSRFFSEHIVGQEHQSKTIITVSEFNKEERVESTNPNIDTPKLDGRHEEADTRIILHWIHN